MKKTRGGPSKVSDARKLVKMIDPSSQYRSSNDWLAAAYDIAEKERQSMRELYLEKSGWDTFGEVRGE